MEAFLKLLTTIFASVISNRICKYLDKKKIRFVTKKGQATKRPK